MKDQNQFESKVNEILQLIRKSQFNDSLTKLNKLLKKNKNFYLYYLKGLVFLNIRNFNDAIKNLKLCIDCKPGFFEGYNALGIAYSNLEQHQKAILSFKQAILFNNSFIEAKYNLANSLRNLHKPFESIKILNEILEINPKDRIALNQMADHYSDLNDPWRAIELRKKCIEITSDDPGILLALGRDFLRIGDRKNALLSYQKSYQIKSNIASLSGMLDAGFSFTNEHIAHIEMIFNHSKIIDEKFDAGFVLAKIFAQNKKYEESFEFLKKANKLKYSLRPYNKKNTIDYFEKIKKIFKKIQNKKYKFEKFDQTPIFILGLPRSGSTLCEQLITNYPDVYGAGETGQLGFLLNELFAKKDINKDDIHNVRNEYFSFIKKLTNQPFFTDKTPMNFFHVGLINIIFPEAFIILTNRDTFSTAFSIYEQNFSYRNYYAFDQKSIADYIKIYFEVIKFWEKENCEKLIKFNYEDLIKSPKKEVKKLFDFLNFKFAQNILNIEENKRSVSTASSSQVRKGINKLGIKSWFKYGDSIIEFKNMIDELSI